MPRLAESNPQPRVAGRRIATVLLALLVSLLAGAGTALAASRPTGSWGTTSQGSVLMTYTLPSGRQFDVQYMRPTWRPAPLIVMLPGLNESAAQLEADSHAYGFGRTHGATIVYGHAAPAADGTAAWNAGACCEKQTTDDLAYLRDVVAATEQLTSVDARRVYVVGMSNGGMMALRAVCDAPDLFAAAVSVAGPYLGSTCARPNWLHLAGTADSIVPVRGGTEAFCGCTFPATTTEAQRFRGAQVQLVSGANHTWPQATDRAWKFDGMERAWAYLSPRTLS